MLLKEIDHEQNVSMTKFKAERRLHRQINEKKGSSNCFVIHLLQAVFVEQPRLKTLNKRWAGTFGKKKAISKSIDPQ